MSQSSDNLQSVPSQGPVQQQLQQFVLPSISGLENNGHHAGEQQQQQQQQQQPQQRLPFVGRSKGFSVASLDNPLPAEQQQQLPNVPAEHIPDGSFKPLNFKDALSYLEQVKFQFNSRPDVYNHFLDIMKDYKSQAIDTLGVIERISTLFKGYPVLIQGLNTFLPQGYRIECAQDANDPNFISVTTPFDGHPHRPTRLDQHEMALNAPGVGAPSLSNPLSETSTPQGTATATATTATDRGSSIVETGQPTLPGPQAIFPAKSLQQQQQQQPQQQMEQPDQSPSSLQAQQQPLQTAQPYLAARSTGDVEFSHAISYVNKIKTRFADQPDIYKHFLEILQTYQREQKPIHEVYAQVTTLFQNAPDLLDDFKKFLPDATAAHEQQMQQIQQQQQQHLQHLQQLQQHQQLQIQQMNQGALLPGHVQPDQHLDQSQLRQRQEMEQHRQNLQQSYNGGPAFFPGQQPRAQNLPPLGSFSPPINGRDNEPPISLPAVQSGAPSIPSRASQPPAQLPAQGMANKTLPLSEVRGPIDGGFAPPSLHYQDIQYMEPTSRPEIDLDPSLVPVIPEPIRPLESDITLIEETSFFDRAKKYMGNKQIYMEFLKILNLYSQDLIDTDELVDKIEHYLGGNIELFDWFKSFVNYVEKPKCIENVMHEKHRLDLDMCEACCPSYKKLPKTDTFMPCSGRDAMCWEVLNDEWVGHPVWASEDSGFIAHRKNQYEETLFKIEEERHEYDFYIEANLRTIQTLETIANKIASMTPEEKQTFKLPPGLGHTSLTIYKKVIRKIYDKDRGFEIIDALHENPSVSVPIVLKRLKQKDEEWRRAQREWNKVWRELEQKVFYKSLDHLGLTFKQADKKLLTAKQLISEISSIKVDQTNKRIYPFTPKPESQLEYDLVDKGVLFDILELVSVFINHSTTYSSGDKERLLEFFKGFLSVFFAIPHDKFDNVGQQESHSPSDDERGSALATPSRKRKRQDDHILRDMLKGKSKHTRKGDGTHDEGASSDDQDLPDSDAHVNGDEEIITEEAKKPWLLGSVIEEANDHGYVPNRSTYNLFANANIYVFFRHLTTLYQRLHEVKSINQAVTAEIKSRKISEFAKDLNLLSNQLSDMGLDFKESDAYEQLLNLCKRLIENDIEHQWFEESLRQAYKNKAFKLYTVDKVVQWLVKHMHTIIADAKTSEIAVLFEKDRTSASTSRRDQILYRLQVRSHMGLSDNMFRIEYNQQTSHVCIQFVAVDDLTLKEPESLKDRWQYYLTSYALSHPTEGVSHEEIKVPFLVKNLREDEQGSDDERASPLGQSVSSLRIQVNPENYELQIEPNSKDLFTRSATNKFPIKMASLNSQEKDSKKKQVDEFLNSEHGWKKGLSEKSVTNAEGSLNYVRDHGKVKPAITTDAAVPATEPAEVEAAADKTGDDTDIRGDDTTTEEI
ncbi:transcriptional regulator SIN3 LALA0_S08e01376g [Lachancea lanzarotensis]|uniref:LALA0S08e01376g1_1 n=1 Tax=Lachancea lanzarotensis TaxID=1245769 RepID=A0A0C7NCK3_9SACH|nr:uncharacterized protein LALA0_S08e01376g [Lachancea lanzarotensis]CEP63391.1 LALA0S08e01376g1_1 [Lachancea lanzarotensis]